MKNDLHRPTAISTTDTTTTIDQRITPGHPRRRMEACSWLIVGLPFPSWSEPNFAGVSCRRSKSCRTSGKALPASPLLSLFVRIVEHLIGGAIWFVEWSAAPVFVGGITRPKGYVVNLFGAGRFGPDQKQVLLG
jgi:hypothetical protein